MNTGFVVAAAASLLTAAVHVFAGGVYVARPLLAVQGLTRASRWLNYYCWHITSILLVAASGSFLYAAVVPGGLPLAVLFTGLGFVFSLLSAAVALRGGIAPWRFPSTSLLLLVGACGAWGLAT